METRREQLFGRYQAGVRADAELQKLAEKIRVIEGSSLPVDVGYLRFLRKVTLGEPVSTELRALYEGVVKLRAAIDDGIVAKRDLMAMPIGWIDDEMRELKKEARACQNIRAQLEGERDRLHEAGLPAATDLRLVQAELEECRQRNSELQSQMTKLCERKLELSPQQPEEAAA